MEKHTEEVDLFYVVKKLKNLYHLFLLKFYETSKALWHNKWTLLVLVLIGVGAGQLYHTYEKKEYFVEMIIGNSAGSIHYIYESIRTLNENSSNEEFLVNNGFDEGISGKFRVAIEPILNFNDLVSNSEPNDRNIETFISRLDAEENVLRTEVFLEQYLNHRITIYSFNSDMKIISDIQKYLNNNPVFKEILNNANSEKESILEENVQSIIYINEFLKNMANEKGLKDELKVAENKLSIATIADIFQVKQSLLQKNVAIKDNLLKSKEIILIFNVPQFKEIDRFDKRVLIPLVALIIFFVNTLLKGLYLKGKKHASAA